jgi:hypothetical protein
MNVRFNDNDYIEIVNNMLLNNFLWSFWRQSTEKLDQPGRSANGTEHGTIANEFLFCELEKVLIGNSENFN